MSLVIGCAPGLRTVSKNPDFCAVLDSLYQRAGFVAAVTINGKATVDANQYRVRGIINLEAIPTGDVFLEFRSSILFGGQVEDFFFSVVSDTIRVLDRERGQFYEGEDAEQLLSESLEMDFGVREALRLALGAHPPCDEVGDVRVRRNGAGAIVDGRLPTGSFHIEFSRDNGRLKEVVWPLLDRRMADRLRAEYEWGGTGTEALGLRGMVIYLEEREWRCRIVASTH
ncbi:MAG: hypothetical protein OEN01_04710 [Candidatus Krumholzibacteria bacterium]|nr:hypothetical protein [Candidatus Krumholzibacteria bacterium]